MFEIQHNLWSSDPVGSRVWTATASFSCAAASEVVCRPPRLRSRLGFHADFEGLWNHFLEDDTYRRDVAIVSKTSWPRIWKMRAPAATHHRHHAKQPQRLHWILAGEYSNYKAAGTNVNGEHLTKAQNTHVFRYADVLLMLAEALPPEATAKPCFTSTWFANAQRVLATTAGRSGPRPWSWLKGWTLQDLIGTNAAPNWRARRRWFDLVRSGRANAACVGDGNKEANFDLKTFGFHRL